MTSRGPTGRAAGRERLLALFLLGVAAVLLLSSPTWFGSGQAGVGVGQLVVGVVVAAAGLWLHRRARAGRRG
ncbi:hypothetical protein OF117_11930 [Geodermatophilus sp. YIM 151500]|uniref:hypothetical protein n=1 Tax=Geodermatophilus sp. YIM 151500 TaxID=2984531 RepID=UPI0021E3CE82|nr:hypothetical protein [Geodermatophilus sp. YIM 151500]MCV2490071.1 hypothetical protein [Geodermatophilus sp. YIM 151500]